MSKHTATPWAMEVSEVVPEGCAPQPFVAIKDASGESIGYLSLDPSLVVERAETIVRAVNSHEALVEALRFVLTAHGEQQHDAYDQAHRVLASVEPSP